MKYVFKIFLLSLILSSCNKDDVDYTHISFQETEYNVEHEAQTFNIVLDFDQAAPSTVNIPLIFEGDAKRLDDYKCSTEITIREGDLGSEFQFEVLLNPNNSDMKTLKISLALPSDYKYGNNSSTVVNIR